MTLLGISVPQVAAGEAGRLAFCGCELSVCNEEEGKVSASLILQSMIIFLVKHKAESSYPKTY